MKKTNKSIKLLKAEIIEQLYKIDDKNALIDILDYTNTFDVTPIKKFETNNEEIYLKNIAGEHWYAGGLSSSRDSDEFIEFVKQMLPSDYEYFEEKENEYNAMIKK